MTSETMTPPLHFRDTTPLRNRSGPLDTTRVRQGQVMTSVELPFGLAFYLRSPMQSYRSTTCIPKNRQALAYENLCCWNLPRGLWVPWEQPLHSTKLSCLWRYIDKLTCDRRMESCQYSLTCFPCCLNYSVMEQDGFKQRCSLPVQKGVAIDVVDAWQHCYIDVTGVQNLKSNTINKYQ